MYSVRYNCSNCGFSFLKSFSKGTSAPHTIACENCGCYAAGKSWNVQIDKKWEEPYIAPYSPSKPWPYYPEPSPSPWYDPRPYPWEEPYDWHWDYNTWC